MKSTTCKMLNYRVFCKRRYLNCIEPDCTLINEWGFPILAASMEQYFPGAQSSSLMVNSGDGAFGAFRCRIYILIRLAQSSIFILLFVCQIYAPLICFVCWPLFCLCRPFCFFERCLDSNPESCRSIQAR
jgi:hypothetical protein